VVEEGVAQLLEEDPYPYLHLPYPQPMWVQKPLTITKLSHQKNGEVVGDLVHIFNLPK